MIRYFFITFLNKLTRPLHSALALFALTTLTSCSPTTETPLRVGTIPWPGYESLYLAQSLEYFQSSQIRLTEMANASQTSRALRNSTLEASFCTLDEALGLMQDGVDLRVILVADISQGADAVLARPDITRLQDLRGKRIAVENAAVGAIMLDAVLEAAKLTASDVELVAATGDQHTKLYQSGAVDAVITFEPNRSAILKLGGHVLFDSNAIPDRIMDVLVVRADQIAGHKQALTALVAAHFRALNYQAQQPQDAAKRIAPFLAVTADEIAAQYEGIKIPTLAENHAYLSGTQPRLKASAANLAALMLRNKLLQHAVNAEQLAEPKFLPASSK